MPVVKSEDDEVLHDAATYNPGYTRCYDFSVVIAVFLVIVRVLEEKKGIK